MYSFNSSEIVQSKNTNLLIFEGSQHGKLLSFSAGGDILMGRNIIARSVSWLTGGGITTGCLSRREKSNQIRESDRLYLVNIYRAQHLLHLLSSRLQVVTIMDGAVMGSGVLFGLNATHSVVTERTYWGLPEVREEQTSSEPHHELCPGQHSRDA